MKKHVPLNTIHWRMASLPMSYGIHFNSIHTRPSPLTLANSRSVVVREEHPYQSMWPAVLLVRSLVSCSYRQSTLGCICSSLHCRHLYQWWSIGSHTLQGMLGCWQKIWLCINTFVRSFQIALSLVPRNWTCTNWACLVTMEASLEESCATLHLKPCDCSIHLLVKEKGH